MEVHVQLVLTVVHLVHHQLFVQSVQVDLKNQATVVYHVERVALLVMAVLVLHVIQGII